MGSAKITYSFPNMSDFQYLPTERVVNDAGVRQSEKDRRENEIFRSAETSLSVCITGYSAIKIV